MVAAAGSPRRHRSSRNRGRWGWNAVTDPNRLTTPLVRRDGQLVEVSWEEALEVVAQGLAPHRGSAFGAIASPEATNEEAYLLQKLARAVMGSNNVDNYARLDHPNLVAPLRESLGWPAATAPLDDLAEATTIFIIGSDTEVTHPIAAWRARTNARQDGGRLIVANPRWNEMCKWADQWLRYRPGTEVALLGGIMKVVLDEGLQNQMFIEARCQDIAALQGSLASFNLDQVVSITGISAREIQETARTLSSNGPLSILFDSGLIDYSVDGSQAVAALVDLALLTGNLGLDGAGLFPLRGAGNQQGAEDMGCIPGFYPGHSPITDGEARTALERTWGLSLSQEPGLSRNQMVEASRSGRVKALYIAGENPVVDDPLKDEIRAALGNLDFLVVHDSTLTETAQLAHVVLPAAAFTEEDGTFTNTERRVQRARKVLEPTGAAYPGWWILSQIAQHLGGNDFQYNGPEAIVDEIARVVPIYGGISYERLEEGGIQWPCPSTDHPGTPVLYRDGFPTGRARFLPIYQPTLETPDGEYSLVAAAGRDLYRYDKEVLAGKNGGPASILEKELLKIHPDDALSLGLRGGEVVRVSSREQSIELRANVSDEAPPGTVCVSFPILERPSELMGSPGAEIVTALPHLNLKAVKVERVSG